MTLPPSLPGFTLFPCLCELRVVLAPYTPVQHAYPVFASRRGPAPMPSLSAAEVVDRRAEIRTDAGPLLRAWRTSQVGVRYALHQRGAIRSAGSVRW